jgi:outer membrane protein TolC
MRFLYALLGLFITQTCLAQIEINNVEGLLQYADEHAALAQQAKLQPQIARQDVKMQASTLYPRVNVFGTGDYYPLIPTQVIPGAFLGKPDSLIKAQFGLPYVFTAGAELSIPVIDLGKWTQLSRTRSQYRQAEWSGKAALENFHIQLITAYYQTLIAKEVLKLNKENEETANELLRIMDERKVQGVVNPADYNRTKNLQLGVTQTEINSLRALQQSTNNLSTLLDADSVILAETVSEFNWPLLGTETEAERRAGWKEADLKVHVAELMLSESRKGGLPKLNLNSRYTYNYQTKFDGSNYNAEFNSANIGLRLDMPLFQGNYYRALQQKSKLQLKAAQLEQEHTHTTLTQQQNDWYELYNAAFTKRSLLEQKLQATSDNLRIGRLSVKEHVMEFDEFNNIFTEYNRAKMEYLQNVADGILYYLLSTQNF